MLVVTPGTSLSANLQGLRLSVHALGLSASPFIGNGISYFHIQSPFFELFQLLSTNYSILQLSRIAIFLNK